MGNVEIEEMNEEWMLASQAVVQIARDETGAVLGIVMVQQERRGLLSISAEDMDELVQIWQEKP